MPAKRTSKRFAVDFTKAETIATGSCLGHWVMCQQSRLDGCLPIATSCFPRLRLSPYLVPRLRLGTHCNSGSAATDQLSDGECVSQLFEDTDACILAMLSVSAALFDLTKTERKATLATKWRQVIAMGVNPCVRVRFMSPHSGLCSLLVLAITPPTLLAISRN